MVLLTAQDALGDRIKKNYENVTRYVLPRRTYTILRLDGRAFHSFTKSMDRPYDLHMMEAMSSVTRHMVNHTGAKIGYTQSDEISLLLTDFNKPSTEAWFGGNIQKMASIAAAECSVHFNDFLGGASAKYVGSLATFDCRVFTIPDPVEVANYFIWRKKDCARNSISMAAQAVFSHKELQGKSSAEMIRMLDDVNRSWDLEDEDFKNGLLVYPSTEVKPVVYVNKRTGEFMATDPVERSVLRSEPAFRFTANDGEELMKLIPRHSFTATDVVTASR